MTAMLTTLDRLAAIRPPTKLISPNITAETMIPSSRLKTSGINAVRIVPPAMICSAMMTVLMMTWMQVLTSENPSPNTQPSILLIVSYSH